MGNDDFFLQRPSVNPTIYVYELSGVESHKGYVKIGYTDRDVHERIKDRRESIRDFRSQGGDRRAGGTDHERAG